MAIESSDYILAREELARQDRAVKRRVDDLLKQNQESEPRPEVSWQVETKGETKEAGLSYFLNEGIGIPI